jgi:PKD repeat protein
MGNRFTFTVAALALVLTAGCTVHQTEQPPLMGPSDFALSLDVSATPDSISQDGASQSSISVTARGADGANKSGVTLRLDMQVGGTTQDFGTLSARTLVTGSDGRANAIYTAPATSPTAGGSGTMVSILASPIGTNAQAGEGRTAAIRLVPPGVILPPAGTPTAAFTMSPTPAVANVPIIFDASTSQIGAGATQISSYSWNFGDGSQGTGRTNTHTFRTQATFNVTLTVTNDRGVAASTTVAVAVGALAAPGPRFVFSPAAPSVNQNVLFNADTSTAAPGHRLTAASWNFGDGGTANGFIVSHAFVTAGSYSVVLTVTDDTGQDAVTTAAVAVTVAAAGGGAGGGPTPRFTSSPLSPAVNETVVFDSSSSTVPTGRTLTDYAWNFGDDTPIIHGDNRIIPHQFARAGVFVVNLVLTDSTGASGQTSANVVVGSGNPTAFLQVFKTGGNGVLADASASTATGTATITNYRFIWGDGTADTSGGANTAPHTYGAAGAHTVTVVVTDSLGRTSSTSKDITTP